MQEAISVKLFFSLVAAVLLILPCAVYADGESRSQYASHSLEFQMDNLGCRNGYLTGYLDDVTSAINNATITSTITSTDIPKINSDYSVLQSDATANDATLFKEDIKTYDDDAKIANLDARLALNAAHDTTVYSALKSGLGQLKSDYASCSFGVRDQYAKLRVQMFSSSISHMQNMTHRLESHGVNTTGISNTLNLATSHVQTFEEAVNNAQNKTHLHTAMKSFCLYNGCKTDNNFHLAATVAIEKNQAMLNYLATKNTTSSYQGLVILAQTDLGNAQTALSQVGSSKYQASQSSEVWMQIKAAGDLIHQLQLVNHNP